MRSWVRPLAAAVLLFSSQAIAGTTSDGAKSYIDSVAKQVLDILKTDAGQSAKQQQLVKVFGSTVDIDFVGKFVLGRHWKAATPEQQKAYLVAYEPFILNNYARKLTRYSGQQYKLKEARESGGNYIVTMEIMDGDKPPVFVDYWLRGNGSGYRLVDIAVEGVSLLATQRSEFNAIVQGKGMDHLVKALEKQAKALQNIED